ncbi:MAG: hypothetical protein M1833_002773, partial [Piccolia ochrophora]
MGSAIPRALNRGAVASDPGTGRETDKDEYTVLMTGFGPFSPNYPLNPSHLLASSLPSTLPLYPTEPSSPPPDPTTTPSSNPTIRIITYPTAIRVSYSTVASLIPSLYTTTTTTTSSSESSPSDPPSTRSLAPDFVIHMGMAAGRAYYTLETGAWRDGYDRRKTDGGRDVDGQVVRSAVLEGDED